MNVLVAATVAFVAWLGIVALLVWSMHYHHRGTVDDDEAERP